MDQIKNLADERLASFCVYCAAEIFNRDHVPPKILLDEPYPENLPVVPSCRECNEGFSLDEEYLACLLEYARLGTIEADSIERPKIRRILSEKEALKNLLLGAAKLKESGISITPDDNRVKRVLLKLARGQIAFDMGEPRLEEPAYFDYVPLANLTDEEYQRFETPSVSNLYPEVGSHSMQRLVRNGGLNSIGWNIVQPNRYRYHAWLNDVIGLKFVLSEYLACEVFWEQ